MHKLFKKFLLLFLAAGLLWIIYAASLNYVGICRTQWRTLPDNEKIRIAVDIVNKYENIYTQNPDCQKGLCRQVPYESAESLIKDNPDCCSIKFTQKVSEGYQSTSFWDRIFGNAGYVRIERNAFYLNDQQEKKKTFSTSIVALDNCGNDISD